MRFQFGNSRHVLCLAALILVLTGCASPAAHWSTDSTTPQTWSQIGVTFLIPAGWSLSRSPKAILLTRDAPSLQTIYLTRERYGSPIEHCDRTISAGMTLDEVAELVVSTMARDRSVHDFAVESRSPANVAGHPGISINVRHTTATGLVVRTSCRLALLDDTYVFALFYAPARYYFDRYSADFTTLVETAQLGRMPGSKP